MTRALRIAQVAPPVERVPPRGYGGTERIVHELVLGLLRRGHDVTTFASADSDVPGRHVATVAEALRPAGIEIEQSPYFVNTLTAVLDHAAEFDVIHAHLEWYTALLARVAPVPVVGTFHGRLDLPWYRVNLAEPRLHRVAISESQAAVHPDLDWTVVHNGLTLADAPFDLKRGDGLAFVGRVEPEKGILDAIEIARLAGRPLRIAAKIGTQPDQRAYHEDVFLPALEKAGRDVEFLGEITGDERDRLLAESHASLMPGTWPEPFGLSAIESLACGTPVIASRVGALPEIIRHGVDGFFGDDVTQMAFVLDLVDGLDRAAIRTSVLERFSASRMVDGYEALYERVLGDRRLERDPDGRQASMQPGAQPPVALRWSRPDIRAPREPATGARPGFRMGTRPVPSAPVTPSNVGRGATSGDRSRG